MFIYDINWSMALIVATCKIVICSTTRSRVTP